MHSHSRAKCKNEEDKDDKEEKESKKFTGTCNHCNKLGHKAADCWKLEENKDKSPKNWKDNGVKEV